MTTPDFRAIAAISVTRRLERQWPQAQRSRLADLAEATVRRHPLRPRKFYHCRPRPNWPATSLACECALKAARQARRNPHTIYAVSLENVIMTVTVKLQSYQAEDTPAWAALGVAEAIAKLRPAEIAKANDPTKWLAKHLAVKGRYLAIDAMRSVGVITRIRNGKPCHPRIKAHNFTDIDPSSDRRLAEIVQ